MFTGGDFNYSYWYPLSHMYCGIREHGFPKENIFVLSSDGKVSVDNYSLDLDNDGVNDIIPDVCSVEHLQIVTQELKEKMTPGDLLFVFVTTHGILYTEPLSTGFRLYDFEYLPDFAFANMLKDINCAQMIFVLGLCNSGGFTDNLLAMENTAKKTVITCTQWEENYIRNISFANQTGMDKYNYLICSALRGGHPDVLDPLNRAPWNVTYPIGSLPQFQTLFNQQEPEKNFDLPENGGNGNNIQEILEALNYTEYDPNFHGDKVYDCGFYQDQSKQPRPAEDLLSLFGITGKVQFTQTVTGNFLIGGTLSIEPGVELTLAKDATFYVFNSEIVVKPSSQSLGLNGGELTIDGAKITSANDRSTWKGIEVRGNSVLNQIPSTKQGRLFLSDGGTIENAEIGILASRRGVNGPEVPQSDFSGGIVLCDSGYLTNNVNGAVFASYSFNNQSTFNRVNFVTDGNMISGIYPECFAKLYGVNQVRFKGCTFINSSPVVQLYELRGIGILGFNTNFRVEEACLSGDAPCSHIRQSVFQGLFRGIYAANSGSSYSPYISNSIFRDNLNGLYLSGYNGISSPTIINNDFRVIHPYGYSFETIYGMYLDNCSGYHVEGNRFFSETTYPDGIGLIVNNSGIEPNEIYRNTFYNLCYATISQNENRNYNPPLHLGGLCYKCNKFVREDLEKPNSYDFSITYNMTYGNTTGIAKNQGTYISGTTFSPAGNMFKDGPPTGHYDFYNEANPIDYYYHNSSSLPFRLKPLPQYIYGTVTSTPVEADFTESSCPSTIENITPELLVEQLITATDSANSLGSVLTNLVDGGSTELLNYEVESSTPPQALLIRNELLNKSPYLSDTVMKTSVVKEEVLDNAMIRDVLVANPHSAKSDEIIGMLEERAVPIPDYMMEQILAGEDTVSAKEVMEANKAYWDCVSANSYCRLIRYFKSDSSSSAKDDSLVWLMNYRNTMDAYYNKAIWYHSKGEYSQAYNVLLSIPSVFSLTPLQMETNQNFIDFFTLSEQIKTDTIHPFGLDSLTQNLLVVIAENDPGVPGTYARNWLIAAGKIHYQEPIILPDSGLKSAKKKKFKGVKETGSGCILSVFPNPAHDYCVVKINTGDLTGHAALTLYNENGLVLQSYLVKRSQDQIIIPTTNLKPGIYIFVLEFEGNHREKVKLTVIK